MTATGMWGDILSSDTQWWWSFRLRPSFDCSTQRITMRGVTHTGTKRNTITARMVEAKNAATTLMMIFRISFISYCSVPASAA